MTQLQNSILLIDDEPQIRKFLRISLNAQGYRVLEAGTGEEGLAQAALNRPDLVVLDLGLPDRDGQDILRDLREWSQVPVLVLSVRASEGEKVLALDGGARALMRDDLGRVETGCLADLIAIDLRRPQMMATSSLVNSLVESACGGDVVHSVIHGNVVMKDRELLTID